MHKIDQASPPNALVEAWSRQGVIDRGAQWLRQMGGHSNPVWRVSDGDVDLICKLYHPENHSALFANNPDHEAIALHALAGQGIAPKLVARLQVAGQNSLVYSYLDGPQWRGRVEDVARLLSALHSQPFPKGLPEYSSAPDDLIAQTLHMQSDMQIGTLATTLPPAPAPVFLHGDVVPGNLVETDQGLRLIDWQCPGVGDPCLDIAVFLSPAMQVIYGHRPLTDPEITQFFEAYGRDEVRKRYCALAPYFHARMAAYCLWKGARGSAAHASAAALELQALDQL